MRTASNKETPASATRRVAKVLFSTIKKIGNNRGVTLRTIHNYIKDQYPNSPTNIVRLNNTLAKALAFGAINKKLGNKKQINRYILGPLLKGTISASRRGGGDIIEARRRRRRRRGRSRSRRGRRGRRGKRGRSGRGRRRGTSRLRRHIKAKSVS